MTTLLPFPPPALELQRFANALPLWQRACNALASGTFPSTVMLVGEPLTGREALAVELAAALVCPQGGKLCRCSSCQRVRAGVHPDVQVVQVGQGHQEIRLEDVHEVLEGVRQVPFEGKRRVYILTNAHTPPLNSFAASALLKTLEEPVAHAHWLLLAANPLRVLPTIVSRAVLLRVPPPPSALGEEWGQPARALVGAVPVALGLLASEGAEAEALLAKAQALFHQASQQKLLALLQLAALAKAKPTRAALFAALAVAAAGQASGEQAETLLLMAEQWLRAQSLHERLHWPFEAVAVASLAPLLPSP